MAPSREIEKLQRRWQENPLGLTFAPLAEAYRKEGMYEDALELLSIGLAQHPNYVPAHIVRGRCYVDSGLDTAAEEAFQRVTELDAENVIALKGLADLAEKGGRIDDAIGRLERLLDFDRSNDDARTQVERLRAARVPAVEAEPEATVADSAAAEGPGAESAAEAPDAAALAEAATSSEAEATPAPDEAPAAAEPPVDEVRAAVVDLSAAEVEVITYRPVELVAASESEYQLADDAASLTASAAEPAAAEQAAAQDADPVSHPLELVEPLTGPVEAPIDAGARGADRAAVSAAQPEPAEFAVPTAVDPPAFVPSPVAEAVAAAEVPQVVEVTGDAATVEAPAVAELAVPAPSEPDASLVAPEVPEEVAAAAAGSAIDTAEIEVAEAEVARSVEAERESAPAARQLEASDAASDDIVAAAGDEPPTPEADETAFDVEALDPERDDAEAVAGVEAEPDLVVTETMAELFLRQGHRTLALAVYTQLSERDPDNPRIRGAIEQLHAELRPGSSVGIPAYAAVLTGGQSVRAFFEHLLAATRPVAPEHQATGLSLGAVFGEERAAPTAAAPAEDRGPSYDEFFAEEQPAAELPKRPDHEGAAVDAASEDLEHFTSWLKGLKR
ncbi:MAG: tetratricopeptide repeat protein [Gemmatimonadales bacterium]|nr:tetratricopeptide repeat protein [Gemmatimonadales bacterium]